MINGFNFERFENYIGFENNNEFLPNGFDEFKSKEKLRQLFLNLANNIFKCTCHFNKYEQNFLSNYTLKNAFEYKIKQLLPIGNYVNSISLNKTLTFKFCRNSTLIINNYLNNSNKRLLITNKVSLKAAKLISSCFSENSMKLLIDKHILFHEFVLKKIKKLHSDKTVIDLGDAICIKSNDFYGIKIYTSWKNIEVNKPNIQEELEDAVKSIKNGEYYQIYLAYPKNDTFKKQIPIYVDELKNEEYQIKAIPYSLRSIIK